MNQLRSMPFRPLRVGDSGSVGDQRRYPAITPSGSPDWQAGDANVQGWSISEVRWCHGEIRTRTLYPKIEGMAYVTGARIVVCSNQWAHAKSKHGITFGAGLTHLAVTVVQNRVVKRRAVEAVGGKYLSGQMRFPWLESIVFGPSTGPRGSAGEIHLCATHVTTFGDKECAMLLLRLRRPAETERFVQAVIDAVRADRSEWGPKAGQVRSTLDGLPSVGSVVAAPGSLARVHLAGSFIADDASAGEGVNSSRSFAPEVSRLHAMEVPSRDS